MATKYIKDNYSSSRWDGDIPSEVVKLALLLGIETSFKDARKALRSMLWQAAIITHPEGNRRYKSFIFRIKDNRLLHIHRIKCEDCSDRKRITVQEECPRCNGKKCNACRNTGVREGMVACPSCVCTETQQPEDKQPENKQDTMLDTILAQDKEERAERFRVSRMLGYH